MNSVFHNGGQVEDNGSQCEDVYIDLYDDLVENPETKLQELIEDSILHGLSNNETEKLEQISDRNKSLSRIRAGNGRLAKVPSMKLTLDGTKYRKR